jgi:hypothetical protein
MRTLGAAKSENDPLLAKFHDCNHSINMDAKGEAIVSAAFRDVNVQ